MAAPAHETGTLPPPEEDYYGLLKVDPTASPDNIKDAYKKIAMELHPDKRSGLGIEDDAAAVHLFSRVTQAYEVLHDPLSRAWYDMLVGIRPESDQEIRRINKLKRAQAEQSLANMAHSVEFIRQAERERNGLIIVEAQYGDINKEFQGAKLNVTVPMQCLVEESRLVIHGGTAKCWLEGFYDPSDGALNQLYVRYMFLGQMHECVVDDCEELVIPLQEHVITIDRIRDQEKAQFREKRKRMKEEQAVKRRRRWWFVGALAFVMGLFVAKRQGYLDNIKIGDKAFSTPLLMNLFGTKDEQKKIEASS